MTEHDCQPTAEPESALLTLIVEYLQRGPASTGYIASHFGMTFAEAYGATGALSRAGRIRRGKQLGWEVVNPSDSLPVATETEPNWRITVKRLGESCETFEIDGDDLTACWKEIESDLRSAGLLVT